MGKTSTARSGASAYATQDPFAFGADGPQALGVQNMITMMMAPWTAFVALSAEMTRDSLHAFRD
jgi:hypothetical protein